MSLEIIPFEPENSEHTNKFRALNEAWLKKFFYLESKDRKILMDSKANIINKGGYIYFARYNGEIVGCYALLPHSASQYELSKMAVDPVYQGLKIGQTLLKHAINIGQQNNWEKIILYSSTRLENAIYMYKKIGFKEVQLEESLPYSRSDIKMEMALT
ncbi:GNAT family N-acetyltransferase [Arenibacter latericius]|uniref:GNAT family N-acetyltransferase n=1 Tax=Arenibacter latericius TaxID=86104 RepID=UPI00041A5C5C|nr:GNAT family N-acetyltransferase [Arenibacter latericius]MDX1362643.1 GNAT family N-acetyltransferase [Arenibacter latericius]